MKFLFFTISLWVHLSFPQIFQILTWVLLIFLDITIVVHRFITALTRFPRPYTCYELAHAKVLVLYLRVILVVF